MQKFKISSLAALMLLFLLIFSSCSKEDEIQKGVPKEEEQKENFSAQIETRDFIPSLFGSNKIVPAQVARSIAERINMTVSEGMVVGTLTSIRIVDSLYT